MVGSSLGASPSQMEFSCTFKPCPLLLFIFSIEIVLETQLSLVLFSKMAYSTSESHGILSETFIKKKKNPIWNLPGKSWLLGNWYKGAHFVLHFPYLVSRSTFFFWPDEHSIFMKTFFKNKTT